MVHEFTILYYMEELKLAHEITIQNLYTKPKLECIRAHFHAKKLVDDEFEQKSLKQNVLFSAIMLRSFMVQTSQVLKPDRNFGQSTRFSILQIKCPWEG